MCSKHREDATKIKKRLLEQRDLSARSLKQLPLWQGSLHVSGQVAHLIITCMALAWQLSPCHVMLLSAALQIPICHSRQCSNPVIMMYKPYAFELASWDRPIHVALRIPGLMCRLCQSESRHRAWLANPRLALQPSASQIPWCAVPAPWLRL